jgi:hypothetical protein
MEPVSSEMVVFLYVLASKQCGRCEGYWDCMHQDEPSYLWRHMIIIKHKTEGEDRSCFSVLLIVAQVECLVAYWTEQSGLGLNDAVPWFLKFKRLR